jgi:ABC-type Fe3+/spermidine/putrescine transport system ATPase subunit
LQFDSPETVYARPATARVAQLTGAVTLVSGTASGEVAQTALGAIPLLDSAEGKVTVAVRPEAVQFVAADGGPGRLVGRRYVGGGYRLTVRMAEMDVVVETVGGSVPALGTAGKLVIPKPCPVF